MFSKIKFWKRKRKIEAAMEPLSPPFEETLPEDEITLNEGHPI